MKLIEAMKQVKLNKVKIQDLQNLITKNCANYLHETPEYGNDTEKKVQEWLQSCQSLSLDNVRLLCDIQRTNLKTIVSIELDGVTVNHNIAEWVWRRREYAQLDMKTWNCLTDRGLKDAVANTSTTTPFELKVVRHFKPSIRDTKLAAYKEEPIKIDSALEVVNAVTDLITKD